MNAYTLSAPWLEAFTVITTGVALIWLLASLVCRLTSSARGQRAIWQTAVLAMAGLLLCELCGLGSSIQAVARLASGGHQPPGAPTAAASLDSSIATIVKLARAQRDFSMEDSVLSTEYSVLSTQNLDTAVGS